MPKIQQSDIGYYYAGSQRIAMRDANGVYFLLSDHLSSSSVVIDESGQIVENGYYLPWGGQRGDEGITTTDYGYTGQMKEDDIYYYNARWPQVPEAQRVGFDPAIGRFMQADTIVPLQVQGTQAFDRYAYVNNNPLRYTDPSGNFAITGAILIGVASGALVGYAGQVIHNLSNDMSFKEALTTDISAGWIIGGAVAGGALGGIGFAALSHFGIINAAATATTTATSLCADGDCTNEATTIYDVFKMQSVRETGILGELASGVQKTFERIISLTNTAKFRIPDNLNHDLRVLTEVKNVTTLRLTNQIKDFALYSNSKGYTFNLISRVTTQITPTMQKFIDEYGIKLLRLIE